MKKIAIIIISLAAVASAVSISSAEQAKNMVASTEAGAVIDAGNKLCPVTGEPVDGVSSYVYEGKKYNLCCSMCTGVFAKDPAKYSAIAEAEVGGKK